MGCAQSDSLEHLSQIYSSSSLFLHSLFKFGEKVHCLSCLMVEHRKVAKVQPHLIEMVEVAQRSYAEYRLIVTYVCMRLKA